MILPNFRLLVTGFMFFFIASHSLVQKTLGVFHKNTDVGAVVHKALFNLMFQLNNIFLSGRPGINIWGSRDDFHYVWRKLKGNFILHYETIFVNLLISPFFQRHNMKRSQIDPMPQFFDRYIQLADDIDIVEALEKYSTIETLLDKDLVEKLGNKVYAEGKWTVNEIVQHMIDNERVQAYRALRIARNDKTPLPGYDENLFAANVQASVRDLGELLEEFAIVRRSNIMLFENFNEEVQQRTGLCNNVPISVLALGFVLVGHQIHHANIIRERYFPLIEQ